MDSISSIASIIRSKRTNNSKLKARNGYNSASQTAPNRTENPAAEIASAISKLPVKKQIEDEGIKILIDGIINWKFGDNALDDPLIRGNSHKVMESILNDKPTKKATQQLIKEILNRKQ